MINWIIFSFVCAIIALIFVFYLTRVVLKAPAGTDTMRSISDAIREGAQAYLKKQYKIVIPFIIVIAIVLVFAAEANSYFTFVIGAILSIIAGYVGMDMATKSNARTAEACKTSLAKGLKIAFTGGSTLGFTAVSLGLLGIAAFYLAFGNSAALFIAAFGFGASWVALFMRVGGGIFTKGADVGADLVGKVEAGIPEDDPRNPATIADNTGDNVGDVAGMGADLLESYVSAIIAAIVVGAIAFTSSMATEGIILPMAIAAGGIIASIIGSVIIMLPRGEITKKGLVNRMRLGVYSASVLVVIFSFIIVYLIMGIEYMNVFYAILAGLVCGIVIGINTEYFTLSSYKPTRNLASAAQTGAGTTIISGMALGMQSTIIPVIAVAVAVYAAYVAAGLYGIAIAGVGMLSTLGVTLATDAYGPIADNAGGIVEMSSLGGELRSRTDALDELGNTTAATGKGFAIGSAALTTLGWVVAFIATANLVMAEYGLDPIVISFEDPKIIAGIFIGALVPFMFSSMTMHGVGKTAMQVVDEVRRQFREITGLMEGKAKPEYGTCVSLVTGSALKEMVGPAVTAIVTPIIVGILLGPASLTGFLVGATASGFILAVMMANAGGAWDNAKKFIEAGNFGGKGSPAHKAAVVGDTVGDPFKDTSGPSINILIKLMSKVALVFIPMFILVLLL